jgi:hypothetical protein
VHHQLCVFVLASSAKDSSRFGDAERYVVLHHSSTPTPNGLRYRPSVPSSGVPRPPNLAGTPRPRLAFIPDARSERRKGGPRRVVVARSRSGETRGVKHNNHGSRLPTKPDAGCHYDEKAATDAFGTTTRSSPTPLWGGILVPVLVCYFGHVGLPTSVLYGNFK